MVLFCLVAWVATQAAETGSEEVIYLEELGLSPVRLRVLRRTPLSQSPNMRRASVYVARGRPIELLGWTEARYYVAARTATGPARGWVDAAAIEPVLAEKVAEIQQLFAQRQRHRALIGRGEVVPGMTRKDVTESLGQPDRRATVRVEAGAIEQWFYTVYRYEPHHQQVPDPDRDGQLRQSLTYRRVP
ncbi:MAG: hypothetical protein GTN90_09740, partial [Xanthomonadales bacterium]|nr:hypothetical protein [Xanthomonadales bacterium]